MKAIVLSSFVAWALVSAPASVRGEICIPPLPERLAHAACAVVGKVVEIEKQTVRATPYAGGQVLVEYQVAVIKVDELLVGDKGVTHIRFGFLGDDSVRRRPVLPANFKPGFEGCFLLVPHHKETFFVPQGYGFGALVSKSDAASFDRDLAPLRRCARLLADPKAGLESKDAEDRLLTAAMLVFRYRSGGGKSEPIAASESKQILAVLRDADWTKSTHEVYPYGVFARLGLPAAEGWQPPKDFEQVSVAAKSWLDKNADSYRVRRFVK